MRLVIDIKGNLIELCVNIMNNTLFIWLYQTYFETNYGTIN